MKHLIPFRKISAKASLEIEIPDNTPEIFRMRVAVEIAVKQKLDLSWSNLEGSNLSWSNLSRSNLSWSNLEGSNLEGSNLEGSNLEGSNLSRSNLSRSNLSRSNLSRSNLSRSNLEGSNLEGAQNLDKIIMPDGITFGDYLRDVVPALLVAGGKTVAEIVAAGAWDCHSWDNCPMHVAFGIKSPDQGPPLLRARIQQFVELFDAKLIPCPIAPESGAASGDTPAA